MDNLERLYVAYKYNTDTNVRLQKYPLPKMIALISANQGYRLSLEYTLHSWDLFVAQVSHIIDEENAKSAWTFMDYFNVILNAKAIIELGCTFYDCKPIYDQFRSSAKIN